MNLIQMKVKEALKSIKGKQVINVLEKVSTPMSDSMMYVNAVKNNTKSAIIVTAADQKLVVVQNEN